MSAARIRIQILDGDTVVHEFTRATARPTADGIRKMTEAAMGWMQAWSGQLGEEQWAADVEKARAAQESGPRP
jgi:hypothetical protein